MRGRWRGGSQRGSSWCCWSVDHTWGSKTLGWVFPHLCRGMVQPCIQRGSAGAHLLLRWLPCVQRLKASEKGGCSSIKVTPAAVTDQPWISVTKPDTSLSPRSIRSSVEAGSMWSFRQSGWWRPCHLQQEASSSPGPWWSREDGGKSEGETPPSWPRGDTPLLCSFHWQEPVWCLSDASTYKWHHVFTLAGN